MKEAIQVLLAVPDGPSAKAIAAEFARDAHTVAVVGDVGRALDACEDEPRDVLVIDARVATEPATACQLLRARLGAGGALVALAERPGDEWLGLLGEALDDVVFAPVDAREVVQRCQARLGTRRAQQKARAERESTPDVNELRARCLRLVAHDINNPLTAIRILSEMLAGEFDDPDLRRDAEDVLEAADLSTAILESMSGLMRLEGGDEEMTRFTMELGEVVREVVARPFLRNHVRVTLPEGETPLLGDRRKLVRAVSDLMLNAQRLCDGKGRIDLGVAVRGREVELRVSHPAIVLPASRDRLLDIYGTVELRQARVPVAAAGLACAVRIAQLHGGTLTFEPGPGESVCFVMRLPLS